MSPGGLGGGGERAPGRLPGVGRGGGRRWRELGRHLAQDGGERRTASAARVLPLALLLRPRRLPSPFPGPGTADRARPAAGRGLRGLSPHAGRGDGACRRS